MSIRRLIVSALLAVSMLSVPVSVTVAAELPDFTQIVANEGKAVVNISTTSVVKESDSDAFQGMEGDPFFEFFRRFAPPSQQREHRESSLGSGFIVSADGYVLTNAHVVARADEITVKLTDKREYKARVIGSDARTDVALLKIDAQSLPVVRLGNASTLKVGEWVVAIGSPFGFENTVTSGIVSGKNRLLPDENFVPFIQTDAAVNPGNSGGPLFNMKGEVVGINSQIYSRSGGFMGISFSIPIDVAMNVVDQLKTKGKVTRGRIGVSIQEMNKALAASFGLNRTYGALVNSVEKGGPADKVGIRAGDIVLKVNSEEIESSADLPRIISGLQPGKAISLELWRNRASKVMSVVPVELKEEDSRIAQREFRNKPKEQAPVDPALGKLGLALSELSAPQLSRLGVSYGLLVHRATGLAARAGLQPGDVIVGVADQSLTSLSQFKGLMAAVPKNGSAALQVLRQGVMQFVPFGLGANE